MTCFASAIRVVAASSLADMIARKSPMLIRTNFRRSRIRVATRFCWVAPTPGQPAGEIFERCFEMRFSASRSFEIAFDPDDVFRQLDLKPPENVFDRCGSENVLLAFFESLRLENVGRDSTWFTSGRNETRAPRQSANYFGGRSCRC
jgi:hypothetical protein